MSGTARIAFVAMAGLVFWRGMPPVWHWYLRQVYLNPPWTHLQPGLWLLTALLAVGLLAIGLLSAMLVSIAVDLVWKWIKGWPGVRGN
jgi:hypothetical protein